MSESGRPVVEGRNVPVLENIAWYANSPDGYIGKGLDVAGRNGGPHELGGI